MVFIDGANNKNFDLFEWARLYAIDSEKKKMVRGKTGKLISNPELFIRAMLDQSKIESSGVNIAHY